MIEKTREKELIKKLCKEFIKEMFDEEAAKILQDHKDFLKAEKNGEEIKMKTYTEDEVNKIKNEYAEILSEYKLIIKEYKSMLNYPRIATNDKVSIEALKKYSYSTEKANL